MKALSALFLSLTLSLFLMACSKSETPAEPPKQVAPTITTQPSDAQVIVGHNAIFSVAATGTEPLSYQWKKNGANVAGATSTTYVFPSAQSDSAATISCAVTNAVGSAMSRTAVLSLVTLPVILSQPVSQTVEAGLPVTYTVSATGTAPLSYQWKKNGVAIPGVTGSSFRIDTVVQADSGAMFHAVVLNAAGSVTSSSASLTVQTVIAVGRPFLGGTIIWLDPNNPGHGLVAAKHDQTTGYASVPTLEQAEMLCSKYPFEGTTTPFKLPDTTEVKLIKEAYRLGILTGFATSGYGLYGTNLVWNTTPPGFLHLPFNNEMGFGWAGAYVNIRAIRKFEF